MSIMDVPGIVPIGSLESGDTQPDKFWVENDSYSPATFELLYNYFHQRQQRPNFELTTREDGVDGYLVSGVGTEDSFDWLATYDDSGHEKGGGGLGRPKKWTKIVARALTLQSGGVSRQSWLSALSDKIRPLSQFSNSSDAVRLRLAGSLASWDRSSDATNLSWSQALQLIGLRSSQASNELHYALPPALSSKQGDNRNNHDSLNGTVWSPGPQGGSQGQSPLRSNTTTHDNTPVYYLEDPFRKRRDDDDDKVPEEPAGPNA